MKKRKDRFYQSRKILKSAFDGFEDGEAEKDHEYHRQDERKEIEEALEELEDQ